MKYLLTLAIAGSLSTAALAQGMTNEEIIAHQKTLGYSGYFNHKTGENRSENVNYSFTPLEPTTHVNYMVHTSTPRPLSIKITDMTGKMVAQWKPKENKYLERGTIDVSNLKAGKYKYEIYWGVELAYTIPFTKK